MEKLITLPYPDNGLEPVISAQTISFHHGKHLQTYVNNLNNALPNSGLENLPLTEIVKQSTGAIFNNAGQTLNHNLYFLQFKSPTENNSPQGKIASLIDTQYGNFDQFKKQFTQQSTTLFGSGWVWLSLTKDNKLEISQEPNAQNPITRGNTPLLTIDIWEHAYYLDYQNKRAEYINNFWKIINWDVINSRIA